MTKRQAPESADYLGDDRLPKHSKGARPLILTQFPADILKRIFEYLIPGAHIGGGPSMCSMEFHASYGPGNYPARYSKETVCVHFIVEFLRLRHTCHRFMHLLADMVPRLEPAGHDGKWAPPGCGPMACAVPFDDHAYAKELRVTYIHVVHAPIKCWHPHPLVDRLRNFWNRARLRRIIFDALESGARKRNSDTPILATMLANTPWLEQLPTKHLLGPDGACWSMGSRFISLFYLCRTWRRTHNDEGYHEARLRMQVEERLRSRDYFGGSS